MAVGPSRDRRSSISRPDCRTNCCSAPRQRASFGASAGLDVENIVILGMGTGRTSGTVVRAVGANTIPVPILVESSYEIPCRSCGRGRSFFAVSGSGHTDEVNHAAAAAAVLGARLVVVTIGGWLADLPKTMARRCCASRRTCQPGPVWVLSWARC